MMRGVFLIDGYPYGDRLLEDVYFEATLSIEEGIATIEKVEPRSDAKAYLKNIKWENFVPAMKEQLLKDVAHCISYYESEGSSLEEGIKAFTEETGLEAEWFFTEV